MDLISLLLTLRPLAAPAPEQPQPLWWGRAAHALLLNTIRAADENLAQDLHDESGVRPFTASNLLGSSPLRRTDPNKTYTIRYTGLTPQVTDILKQAVSPGGRLAPGQTVTGFELDLTTATGRAELGYCTASNSNCIVLSRNSLAL